MLTIALFGAAFVTADNHVTSLDQPCVNSGTARCGISLDQPSSLDEGVALGLNTNTWQECEIYCNANKYCTFWLFDFSGNIWNTCRIYKQDFRKYLSKCNTVFGDIRITDENNPELRDNKACRDENVDLDDHSCGVIRYGGCSATVSVSETGDFSSNMTESICAEWAMIGNLHSMYQMDREEAACYLYDEFALRCDHIYGPSQHTMKECNYQAAADASDVELTPSEARFDAKQETREGAVCSKYFRNQCAVGDPEESTSKASSEICAEWCNLLHKDNEDNGCDYWVFKSYAPQGHNCLTYLGEISDFFGTCGAFGGVQDRDNMNATTYVSAEQELCLLNAGKNGEDPCTTFLDSECFIDAIVAETIPLATDSTDTFCAAACNVNSACEAFFQDKKNMVCRLYYENPRTCNMHFGLAQQAANSCSLTTTYGEEPSSDLPLLDVCSADVPTPSPTQDCDSTDSGASMASVSAFALIALAATVY